MPKSTLEDLRNRARLQGSAASDLSPGDVQVASASNHQEGDE